MLPVDFEDDDYSPSGPPAPLPAPEVSVTVPLGLAGARFDRALADLFPDHSRSRLAAMAKAGAILLDGRVTEGKTRLLGGETIAATLTPRAEESAFVAEDLPIDILHEDEQVIVINKPAGLVVHPAAGNWSGTLLNALLFHAPQVAVLARAGIVHRLDKDTSGVMVAAKTEVAQLSLVRQLQARTVKRLYLALMRGHVAAAGVVDAPIGRHPRDRVRMAVVEVERGGKPARTHYRPIQKFPAHTLLECSLETGRTHQIRVHMQSIGYPLEGDLVYGPKPGGLDAAMRGAVAEFGRQALHARQLSFLHPATGKPVEFEAAIPADMARLLEAVTEAGGAC
ncbi:MAG: RluA family pseudouridine synthase [Betaproteobacteria bacterium]|nr:RluA family pseudouridine synthase [Betaproteobacteria bacterium]